MPTVAIVIIAIIVTAVITIPVSLAAANQYHQKVSAKKVGNAEDKAREIIDEAVKTAETKKREAQLEAKEDALRTRMN